MSRKDYEELARLFGLKLAMVEIHKEERRQTLYDGAWSIIEAYINYAIEENPRFCRSTFKAAIMDSRDGQIRVRESLSN